MVENSMKTWLSRCLFFLIVLFSSSTIALATTCPNATNISAASLPIVNQSITCGAGNDITSTNAAASVLAGGCSSTAYYNGNEALYTFTPSVTGMYDLSITGQTWTSIFVFNGCPTTAGSTCVAGVATSASSKNVTMTLTAGITYFIMFDTNPSPTSPCPGNFSLQQLVANTATATANGGLWNNPATWVSGVVPNAASSVVIPAGSVVTIDVVTNIVDLSVSGILQWNATANAMNVSGNVTVNSGGALLPYTTGGTTGVNMNIAGNLTNNGYINFAAGTGTAGIINFNGSGSTISGSGTFQGDGTNGIIRVLQFANTGSNVINTDQNLVVYDLRHDGGSLNTNGKISLDNTRVVYNLPLNTSVASIAVTNMGAGYTAQPMIGPSGTTRWAATTALTANTVRAWGGNLYVVTTAGTSAASGPSHTSGTAADGAATLLWVGTSGCLGNAFMSTSNHVIGTQYFYGNNLYVCTTGGAGSAASPPTHVAGIQSAGTAAFRYVGTVARATANFDATSGTVRSISLTQAGSGYFNNAAPTMVIVADQATAPTTAAAASVVVFQSIGSPANSVARRSPGTTISGGLTMNSNGGAATTSSNNIQALSGVDAVYIAGNPGFYNNPVAPPAVGFTLPNNLNLVTNGGSGCTTPVVTVTGGTVVSGTALGAGAFTLTWANGSVTSVYCGSPGSTTYSTPPVVAVTGCTTAPTLAWPVNCLPQATAVLDNGMIKSFTITNKGYGYNTAPAVGLGVTSPGAALTPGTPTARLGLYNYTVAVNAPTTTATAAVGDDAYIPSNRTINTLSLGTNAAGLTVSNNLILIGSSPLSLTSSSNGNGNILDLGGFNLNFPWNLYGGVSGTYNIGGTKAYVANGSITMHGRGTNTWVYPFAGSGTTSVQVFTGAANAATGATNIVTGTITALGAPSNTSVGGAVSMGNRSFRWNSTTLGGGAGVAGTTATFRLPWNDLDGLTTTQNMTYLVEGTSAAGPYTQRSNAVGVSGALATAGTLTSPTAAPGPVSLANGNVIAWGTLAPSITSTTIDGTTVCANSAAFTITGTNLDGVTAVTVAGNPVVAFTVVNSTTINATVGNAGTGVISVTKNGATVSGTATVTVNASPSAPSLTQSAFTAAFGATQSITASGAGGTFNWYNVATGGTAVSTGASFDVPACGTGSNFWVAENDGTCEGIRTQIAVTVSPAVVATASPTFICDSSTPVTLSSNVTGGTYAWTTTQGNLSSATAASPSLTSLNATAEVSATISKNGCSITVPQISVGAYSFPAGISPTASPSVLCEGTPTTLATGLSAGNFTALCTTAPAGLSTPPANATTLILNGVVQTMPAGVSFTAPGLDDSKYGPIPIGFDFNFFGTNISTLNIGTNGVINFGSYASFAGNQFIFTGGFPNASNPASTIAVCARDLRFGTPAGNGTLRYWVEGVAPNRRFVVQYANVPIWSGVVTGANPSGFQNAEAVLYETLGQVDIRVANATNGTSTTAAEINKYIGLQDATRTIGATAPNCSAPFQQNFWNGISNSISSPLAWSFIPPKNYTYNWSNTANTTVENASTASLSGTGSGLASPTSVTTTSTTQSPNGDITYQVFIKDPITECSNVYNVAVDVTATPGAPVTAYGTATPFELCGTQVPNNGNALVSCPTCTGSVSYNWYTAATGGELYQGSISENFNSGTNPGTFTLYGAAGAATGVTGTNQAQLLNTRCELTQPLASQYGAILLGSTGVNTNAYNINFDFQVDQSSGDGGADGMSYSFGDDVVATQELSMNAENGTGSKLKIAFVTYTNGTSPQGIYLMYNSTINEQSTAIANGVLAYSSNVSWKNTSSMVNFSIQIDANGLVDVLLNGSAIFNDVQLPVGYLAENKATWKHVFKARTGGSFSRCAIDNMVVVSQPAQTFSGIVQPVSTSATYYVQGIDGICGSATRTPVAIQVNPAPAFAITPNFTSCANAVSSISVVTGATSYTQFTWAPTVGGFLFSDAACTVPYTGGSATIVYIKPTAVGSLPTITCSALDTNGPAGNQCSSVANCEVNVVAAPAAPVITASATSVCSGNTVTFTTASLTAPYCAPVGNSTTRGINNFSTTGGITNITNNGTGVTGNGYNNYTASLSASQVAGSSINFSVASTSLDDGYAIWVDWNQDGVFQSTERVANTTGWTATFTGSFVVPATALNGTTRMRVLSHYSSTNPADPCVNSTSVEIEDYAFVVSGGVAAPVYTYNWTPALAGNVTTGNGTSNAITSATAFSAVLNDGTCNSLPSNVINVAIAGTPTATATVTAQSGNYCAPVGNSTVRGINSFSTTGGLTNITNNSTGLTGSGYNNYTSTLSVSQEVGGSVSYSVTSISADDGMAIWVDWNRNGTFESTERVANTTGYSATLTGSFTVPATALNGTTRMRVLAHYTAPNPADPCVNSASVEIEDYAFVVVNGVSNTPCPGSTFNLAAVAANGGEPYTYAWTVSPAGAATIANASAASTTAVVNADATFTVTVTDNCTGTVVATTSVADVLENPITVSPATATVCGNPGTTFTASGASTYVWTANITNAALSSTQGASVVASPTETATYTVTGTYGNNCSATATAVLNYTAPAYTVTVNNSLPNSSLCGVAGTATLTAATSGTGNYTYSWTQLSAGSSTFTGATNAATATVSVPQSAESATYEYAVVVSDDQGCSVQNEASVLYFTFPDFQATINGSATTTPQCPNTSINLAAGLSAGAFSVSTATYNFETAPLAGITSLVNNGVADVPISVGFGLDDVAWNNQSIGFPFNFFGTEYTSFNISSNGFLQFTPGNLGSITDLNFANALPTPLEPTNAVFVCAGDWNFNGATSSKLRYWTVGSAPTRKLVIEYDVPGFNGNGQVKAQAHIFETTGVVEVHVAIASSSDAKTVGVQNAAGTIGSAAPNFNASTATNWSNQAWRFNPPVTYTYAWTANNGSTVASATSELTTSTPNVGNNVYSVAITNPISGCVKTDDVSITIAAAPVVSFTSTNPATPCIGSAVTYTTQAGMSFYSWIFNDGNNAPLVLGTDYTVTGNTSTSNSVNVTWLTTGTKKVVVNYNSALGCPSAGAAEAVANPITTVPGTLVFTANAANTGGTIVYNATGAQGSVVGWQRSTDNGTSWQAMSPNGPGSFTFSNLATTTLYRVLVANGSCTVLPTNIITGIIPGNGVANAVVINNIGQFGTGVQTSFSANLAGVSGNEVWYSFTALSNAIRISVVGATGVADDNEISLYDGPATTPMIPLMTENDVNSASAVAEKGSEILLTDQLVPNQPYLFSVKNNNATAGQVTIVISYLRASEGDIMPYTNYSGVYNTTCQNFKAKFRANSTGYTVKRWADQAAANAFVASGTGTPSFVFAIPPGSGTVASTVCQLGRFLPANILSGSAVTYYVTVDASYNLADAAGNMNALTAIGNVVSPIGLNSEADLNVRASDRCPVSKIVATGTIATNRSVCGVRNYDYEFAMVLPSVSIPVNAAGPVGGSRILAINTVPGIGNGQTYDVKIRARHVDNATNSNYGTAACVKTTGVAGMPTIEDEGVIAERSFNGVTTSIYPNPNNGSSVNLNIDGLEGELQVRITDATGRMVYSNRYIVEGAMNTTMDFGQNLAGGVYMVEMVQNGQLNTMRMVVNR